MSGAAQALSEFGCVCVCVKLQSKCSKVSEQAIHPENKAFLVA